jgi:bifunctional DNA-binding transcriptional regulator/antitoxin component of YhaV-PrlF toxin-antitoxin module
MKVKASLDKARRVPLPKPMLKEMHLAPGDELGVECNGDAITVRPVRTKALLKKEFGIWVYQGRPSSQSICRLIDAERTKRLRKLLSS